MSPSSRRPPADLGYEDEPEDDQEPRPAPPAPSRRRVGYRKLTFLPALLVAVLLATWLWFRQADLDALSENALAGGQVTKALWQHVQLTVISTFFVLIIAIPLGVLLTRRMFRRATPAALAVPPTPARPPRPSACWRCW
ncbi:Permease OS=Streptomyces fumanus OX=67302 GN=GCM10018772_07780 PE=3 SV=1 [Streptomyces fumanus]